MAKYIRLTDDERSLAAYQVWASGESNFQTFSSGVDISGIARYPYNWGIDGLDYYLLPQEGTIANVGKYYGSISGIVAMAGAIPQDLKNRPLIKSNLEFEKMDSPQHIDNKPIIHAIPTISGGHISILTPNGLEWQD